MTRRIFIGHINASTDGWFESATQAVDFSIFDATRHQIIDVIILRADDARRSHQRVVACVNLSERRSVSVTQSFHTSIIDREYRTPCFVGVTCAPCIVARGLTSGERSSNQYHHS